MSNRNSSSLFAPADEFADMDLLYPTSSVYQRNGAWGVVIGGGVLILGLALATVLLFQMKSHSGKVYLNPIVTIAVYSLLVVSVRYLLMKYFMPVSVFYDSSSKSVKFIVKGFFGSSLQQLDASQMEHVELRKIVSDKKDFPPQWLITIFLQDGSSHKLPLVTNKLAARQGAERIARRTGRKVVYALGGDTDDGEDAGGFGEPIYKRSNVDKPRPFSDELLIKKEKISGGLRYKIGMPIWVPMGVLVFAMSNLVLGVYIWMRVPKEVGVWASIPFLITTFVVFVVAALLQSFKQPVELTMDGITHRGITIGLDRLEEIQILARLITRVEFIAKDEIFTMLLTAKQADALRADIEYEIFSRKAQIEQKFK